MRPLWARSPAWAFLLALGACSFGDRRVHLRLDQPLGEPDLPRGISVILQQPEDGRPEPHSVVGDVRSGVGVRTAGILTTGNPGLALRISTRIRVLSCWEGIGFGARMSLDFEIHADYGTILEKTYEAEDEHLLVDECSADKAVDSLHLCLRRIVSMFLQDLRVIVERSPD